MIGWFAEHAALFDDERHILLNHIIIKTVMICRKDYRILGSENIGCDRVLTVLTWAFSSAHFSAKGIKSVTFWILIT